MCVGGLIIIMAHMLKLLYWGGCELEKYIEFTHQQLTMSL